MIFSVAEVKTCLLWSMKPYLDKYDIQINSISLKLSQRLMIKAEIKYASNIMHITASCLLAYQDDYLIFKSIDGRVDYSFVSINLISLLSQIIDDEHIQFKDNDIYYQLDLPIKQISIKDEYLHLKLNEM